MTFELQYTDTKSNARAGLITTDHGQIQTPIFMPVGTLGTVKGVHVTELKKISRTDYSGQHLSFILASGTRRN